jgi:hypothetical protein
MGVESIVVNIVSNIGKIAKDTDKATKSLGGFKGAIKGIGTALKAAGIGILLGIMTKFFQVLSKNQTVVDFFNTSMNGLNIILSDLINGFSGFFNFIGDNIGAVVGYFKELFEDPIGKIEDLGNAIWDNLVERFNSLLDTFGHVGKALGHLFEGKFKKAWESAKDAGKELIDVTTGVDNTFDKTVGTVKKVTGAITGYFTGTWEAAKATTELDKQVARLGVTLDAINKKFAANALEQQQIIDNELLSFEKRHEALEELTKLTEKNNQANIAAAALRVKQAQDVFDLNGNEANRIALMKEENALMDAKAQKLAAEDELFDQKILLNDQWNEIQSEAWDKEIKRLEDLEAFKKKLRDDAIAALGANLNASMDKLEGNYSKEKRLAQERHDAILERETELGRDTTKLAKKQKKELEAIDEKHEAKRLKIAKRQKAFAVATALLNTYLGVTEVMKDPTIPSTTLKFIAAATVLASGLANVRSIMAQDIGGGGGGGAGGGMAATPAPEMMSGAFTLSGGQEVEPTRAYVVSDDITNNQNKLAIIRRRATI